MEFKKIGEYQYSYEANIYKTKLESFGIEVFIRDSFTIDANPLISNAIGGVKLYVRNENYINAKKILKSINDYSLDDNGKSIICPNCDNDKIKFQTTIKDFKSFLAFLFSLFFIILPFYTKYKYKCSNCNFEFWLSSNPGILT